MQIRQQLQSQSIMCVSFCFPSVCIGSAVVLTQQLTEQDTEDAGNRLKLSRGISLSFSENNIRTIPRSSVPQEVRYSSCDSQEVQAGVCQYFWIHSVKFQSYSA